jgi:hypothetical protein
MSARAYGHRLSGGERHKFSSGVIHSSLAVPGPLCGKISRRAEHREHSIEANFGLSLIRFPLNLLDQFTTPAENAAALRGVQALHPGSVRTIEMKPDQSRL